jgi:L-threonylcarbamoyladenylate synthase
VTSRENPLMVPIDAARPDTDVLARAVAVLREGGLVAFPTETVYGLGARALDRNAVARVFAAKGRPTAHPLILHVNDEESARAQAASWPECASLLARAFWPGPLTLVVARAPHVPDEVTGGGPSVALRAPVHPVARALIALLGEPIAAPSANRYQTLSPTSALHVAKSLGTRVDLILDGGSCPGGIESTVLDVRGERARLLRPGAIDAPTLRAVLGDRLEVEAPAEIPSDEVRASPGMDERHYAPRARIVLLPLAEAERQAFAHRRDGQVTGLLCHHQPSEDAITAGLLLHRLPDDPKGYERELFATLHACDDAGCTAVFIEAPPEDDERWLAIRDRLRRASA